MRLPAWLLVLGLLLAVPIGAGAAADACPPVARSATPERVEVGMRNALDRGFMWRIEKGEHTSFLFGTVHVAKFDWMFPGPSVRAALLASDSIALELDMLDADIRSRLAAAMAARAEAVLPDALAARLARQAQLACVDAAALAQLEAPLQVMTLSVLAARDAGLDPAYGIDLFLAGFARGLGKPVVSLETPELQMRSLLDGAPEQGQLMIEEGLSDLENARAGAKLARIAQVWADGDHERLQRYEEWCECAASAADRAILKRLLDDRNPALAAQIARLHDAGQRVFAAVGSLHMIGLRSLPALLREHGFRVERVAFKH